MHLAAQASALGDAGMASFEPITADLFATAIQLQDHGIFDSDRLRFERIERKLRQRLRDPALDLAQFAASEGLSLRSFQRLFQLYGTTPTKWVLTQRIEGVARDLCSRSAQRSITEIAYSWGFNDLSYFNRAFRAAYGVSPRSWRERKTA